MAQLTYLNFDITFESGPDGYAVRATSAAAGEARATFVFPFNELELENFLLRLGQRSGGTRHADSPEMELSKQFGGRLFDSLFDDDVRAALRSSVSQSESQGAGLRIRLRFGNAPELADIPWEYLYDGGANRFLTLSRETPLVRYLDLSRPVEPLHVQAPLRILVMISDPNDYDRLDVEAEWQRLNGALADLQGKGLVEIVRLDKATLLELQRVLRDSQFHIFHYIGHGVFDQSADDGFLVLEDDNGRGRKVSGQYVGTLLADHRSLRLAVLNSCEGGRSSRSDPFAGAAQSLVQQGLPAVIAMQFEISDDAAAIFAQEFYMALAGGYPVDGALAEGRRAIFATKTNAEWGIPVLFMRAADGRIFDVSAPALPPASASPQPPTEAEKPTRDEPAPVQSLEIPLSPPVGKNEPPPLPGTVLASLRKGWSKTISPTSSTPADLQMAKIIGGTILGAFLVMALITYLAFRNSTEQAAPAALVPPTIDFFRAEPTQIVAGEDQAVQLTWSIAGDMTGVAVAGPGIDSSLALSRTGSLLVSLDKSATFSLAVSNYDQTTSQPLTISAVNPTSAPAAGGSTLAADSVDVTVTFNSVRIIDDCDTVLTGLGEFWLDLAVNDQHLRWPESGTNEVDSGQSYAIGQSITRRVTDGERLDITGAGFEVDEFQTESMGSIRVSHTASDGWGAGNDSQTSLAVCTFVLNFSVAALPTPASGATDAQTPDPGGDLSDEIAFFVTFDDLSALTKPALGPAGVSNLSAEDFRQAAQDNGAHFSMGRWTRFPFRENGEMLFSPKSGEIEFWYKPDFAADAPPHPRYFVVLGNVYNPPRLMLYHYGTLNFQVGVGFEPDQHLEARSAEWFPKLWEAGQPVHIRVVWDTTAADPVQIYVDWTRVDDGTKPIQMSDARFADVDFLYIGAANALGENSAEGIIDEIFIRR